MDDINKSYRHHRDSMMLMPEPADYVLTLDMLTDLVVCYGRAAQQFDS
jgi:hypothetical protein